MLVGTTLRDRYKIIRQLGSSEFGNTYLVEDMDLPENRLCVIKHLKPKTSDPAVLEVAKSLFDTEAQILYQLGKKCDSFACAKSNRIPQLLARFEKNGEFYLVQEFMAGEDLGKELTPGKQLSESQVVKLLQDTLEVLDFIHDRSIIHQDIKPQNLIRREDGKILLIDLGGVKKISTLTVNDRGEIIQVLPVGTPGYMPPEQVDGNPTLSSDIYAVGMVCIQALTGLLPQQLPINPQTLEVIWRDRVQVSDKLSNILNTMVLCKQSQRYQSASEVLLALFPGVVPLLVNLPQIDELVIQPQFDEIYLFAEDLAPVKLGKQWGYINKIGNFVIERQFDEAYRFSEGLAAVSDGNYYGYIDKTGNLVIDLQFDQAYWFADGLARVQKKDCWGYINSSGDFVIEPQFDYAYWFADGLAPVKKDTYYGYIDKTGKLVIPPQFPTPGWFSEGLMALEVRKWFGFKSGYVDKTGEFIIEPQFDEAYKFAEGLAPVKLENHYGYIDRSGNFVIPPQFDDAYWFDDGLARAKKGNRWGYIDKQGNFVIQPQFEEAYWFVDGLARVQRGDRWGYINKQGNFVIAAQFEVNTSFAEGMAGVQIGNKWGFIRSPLSSYG